MQSTTSFNEFKKLQQQVYSEKKDGDKYEAWMQSVKATLGILNKRPWDLSIYKVPDKVRRLKEDAYNPHLVSIGPFHVSNDKLVAMEEHKWHYMLHFLRRATSNEQGNKSPTDKALEECGKAISTLEEEARACYAEKINLDKHQLVEILLVDGCFILELFIKHADQNQDQDEEEDCNQPSQELDPIINNLWMVPTLQHDLALLENQIPFVVLQKLFDTIEGLANKEFRFSLKKYVLLFFRSALNLSDKAIEDTCTADIVHIADLLHRVVYTPPEKNPNPKEKIEWEFKRCATQLAQSGIQFQPRVDEDCRLLNITFSEGVITIPPLHIQEITDSVFRNLVAFEQCSVGCSRHMASYAWLMKTLIRSSQDAELLRLKGIITNKVGGDEEVSTFFQSLCREVVIKDFCFSDLCEAVNNYNGSWLHWGRIKDEVMDRLDILLKISCHSSIYKVPNKFRRLKEVAYNPHLVSIGPFHASKHELVAMEHYKWDYMLTFLCRAASDDDDDQGSEHLSAKAPEECGKALSELEGEVRACYAENIAIDDDDYQGSEQLYAKAPEECGKALSELEGEVRACYAENINLDEHQLVEILLVDGCFMLELFIKYAGQKQDQDEGEEELDPIINNLWMIPTLQHDLALLENQIPFSVLQRLFDTIDRLAKKKFQFSLKEYVLLFFRSALNLSDKAIEDTCTADIVHITDLLHRVVYTPPEKKS